MSCTLCHKGGWSIISRTITFILLSFIISYVHMSYVLIQRQHLRIVNRVIIVFMISGDRGLESK